MKMADHVGTALGLIPEAAPGRLLFPAGDGLSLQDMT
jgi:hypothetical protein